MLSCIVNTLSSFVGHPRDKQEWWQSEYLIRPQMDTYLTAIDIYTNIIKLRSLFLLYTLI